MKTRAQEPAFITEGAPARPRCAATDDVFIVGGGNSAGQAAMHFARVAHTVYMVVRGHSLHQSLSSYLVDRIMGAPNVYVLINSEVTALHGAEILESIAVTNRQSGGSQTYNTRWLFVCIGGEPNTAWADAVGIIRDSAGYLVTGPDLGHDSRVSSSWPLDRSPYYLETNMPGVFAAGDVRHGSVKRCASGVGEGAMAVALVHRYLATG